MAAAPTAVAAFVSGPVFGFGISIFFGGAVGLFLGGIVAAIYYALNRVLTTGIVTDASDHFWIRFKRSVIEGKKLDQSDAEYVAELIDYLVHQKN